MLCVTSFTHQVFEDIKCLLHALQPNLSRGFCTLSKCRFRFIGDAPFKELLERAIHRATSSVVERPLCMRKVVGSIPTSSKFCRRERLWSFFRRS